MNFVDRTGHIFTSKSYNENPVGFEYEETPYIFWFNSEHGYKLSVNNYYFQAIRILINVDNIIVIENNEKKIDENKFFIEINAQENSIFKLMGSYNIQNMLHANQTLLDNLDFYEYDGIVYDAERVWDEAQQKWIYGNKLFVEQLTKTDLSKIGVIEEVDYYYYITTHYTYNNDDTEYTGPITEINGIKYGDVLGEQVELQEINKEIRIDNNLDIINNTYNEHQVYSHVTNYMVLPFYVLVKSDKAGVWESNLLIHTSINNKEEYCPITVGAEIVDECEELIINGKNMGVKLPKDIIKAVYNGDYYSDYPDERMYANKLKEYLMNYMLLKGETGNMRSAIAGIKWFGWGDKINLYQLLKTDNEFQLTYVRDAFDINNDTIYTFNNFRLATLISLGVKLNDEKCETHQTYPTIEEDKYNFWGEMKPEMEDLLNKMVSQKYDETNIEFYKGYFDYSFNELGLKLCALKYYYKKYFLPLHLTENIVSLEHQCFMNDIKMMIRPHNSIFEHPIFTNGNRSNLNYIVEFPKNKTLYLNHEIHYVDENYCEFVGNKERGENVENINILYINDTVINVPIFFNQTVSEQNYNCILLLVKDGILAHEAHFSFMQKSGVNNRNTWFKNFVIHPKTLNTILTGETTEKFDINYWVNSQCTIHLCVNNIWYRYDFIIALPELRIELGRLKYKYYLNATKNYLESHEQPTMFNQIEKIETKPNGDTYIKFNAFMFQPDLVSVTNATFIDDIVNYAERANLVYLDNTTLTPGTFYYYLEYDNIKYIFSKNSNKIIRASKDNVLLITDGDNIQISYSGDGTYSILFKEAHTRIKNLKLQTNLFQNLESYVNTYYKVSNNFIDDKYLNQIQLIDMYDEDFNPVKFTIGDEHSVLGIMILGRNILGNDFDTDTLTISKYYWGNKSPLSIALYKKFFNNDGKSILDIPVVYDKGTLNTEYTNDVLSNKLNRTHDIDYDFYLMHNNERWHIILISKNTVDNFVNEDLSFSWPSSINTLTIKNVDGHIQRTWGYNDKDKHLLNKEAFLKIEDYINVNTNEPNEPHVNYLVYNRGSKDIIVNRLQYESMNGVNQFDAGDIIACTLTNNDKLPFKLDYGSKWSFTGASIGMNDATDVSSSSEMAIVSIGSTNSKYERGYYNVNCNYSIDGFAQHTYTKYAKFRVNELQQR